MGVMLTTVHRKLLTYTPLLGNFDIKARNLRMDLPTIAYICPICGREMKSKRGLAVHMRAHKARENPKRNQKRGGDD
ncbi:MAG TPA: hypothetical protein EYP17_11680 [Candidatus Latescibacteria bacterium]|nr:hypothetical protein [Candidatus Latescibacterota bacterium]